MTLPEYAALPFSWDVPKDIVEKVMVSCVLMACLLRNPPEISCLASRLFDAVRMRNDFQSGCYISLLSRVLNQVSKLSRPGHVCLT